jgi:hypothetical protein
LDGVVLFLEGYRGEVVVEGSVPVRTLGFVEDP